MTDTKYQRAKILVEETRRFYFQIIFTIGIFIVVAIRSLFITRPFLSPEDSMVFMGENLSIGENISASQVPDLSFMYTPLFMILYIGSIFLLILAFRYLRLYFLKRKFEDSESADKRLKKYMKTDEIPNVDEVEAKFNEDKNKQKKKYYTLVLRVVLLNILMYYLYSTFFSYGVIFEIILAFSVLTLIYRYFIVFHADKKLFGKDWEDKKIEKYIQKFSEFN